MTYILEPNSFSTNPKFKTNKNDHLLKKYREELSGEELGLSISATTPDSKFKKKKFFPIHRKKCKKIEPSNKSSSNCASSHKCLENKIDIKKSIKANKDMSVRKGWKKEIDNITSKILLTYLYDVESPDLVRAVANWQRENCFRKINGVIGAAEWNEIQHILGIHKVLSKVNIKEKKYLRYVNTLMPRSSLGLFATKPPRNRYGLVETIDALITIGINWWLKNPSAPPIQVRDISRPYGSTKKFSTHSSHRMGIDVDIGVMRNDCKRGRTLITSSAYSRKLTQELIDTIINNDVLKVHKIFFDDIGSIAPKGILQCDGLHADHLHVRFCMPSKYNLKAMRKESNTSSKADFAQC